MKEMYLFVSLLLLVDLSASLNESASTPIRFPDHHQSKHYAHHEKRHRPSQSRSEKAFSFPAKKEIVNRVPHNSETGKFDGGLPSLLNLLLYKRHVLNCSLGRDHYMIFPRESYISNLMKKHFKESCTMVNHASVKSTLRNMFSMVDSPLENIRYESDDSFNFNGNIDEYVDDYFPDGKLKPLDNLQYQNFTESGSKHEDKFISYDEIDNHFRAPRDGKSIQVRNSSHALARLQINSLISNHKEDSVNNGGERLGYNAQGLLDLSSENGRPHYGGDRPNYSTQENDYSISVNGASHYGGGRPDYDANYPRDPRPDLELAHYGGGRPDYNAQDPGDSISEYGAPHYGGGRPDFNNQNNGGPSIENGTPHYGGGRRDYNSQNHEGPSLENGTPHYGGGRPDYNTHGHVTPSYGGRPDYSTNNDWEHPIYVSPSYGGRRPDYGYYDPCAPRPPCYIVSYLMVPNSCNCCLCDTNEWLPIVTTSATTSIFFPTTPRTTATEMATTMISTTTTTPFVSEECPVVITAPVFNITRPSGHFCAFIILLEPGHCGFSLFLERFELEASQQCSLESVDILESDPNEIGHLCGNRTGETVSVIGENKIWEVTYTRKAFDQDIPSDFFIKGKQLPCDFFDYPSTTTSSSFKTTTKITETTPIFSDYYDYGISPTPAF